MYEQRQCILIADDEERILRALKDLLGAKGFHVLTAGDGRMALELCDQYREQIDLVLLDVMMPELDGFTVLREIRGQNPSLPVIMLTARGEEYDQLQGFQSGADDYIPKPFSTDLLLARMMAVLRRTGREKRDVIQAGEILMIPEQRKVEASGQSLELTRREFDLLHYLLENKEKVVSRESLLDHVWGFDYAGETNAVDVYIRFLRAKLEEPFGEKFIHTVRGVGYVIREHG